MTDNMATSSWGTFHRPAASGMVSRANCPWKTESLSTQWTADPSRAWGLSLSTGAIAVRAAWGHLPTSGSDEQRMARLPSIEFLQVQGWRTYLVTVGESLPEG